VGNCTDVFRLEPGAGRSVDHVVASRGKPDCCEPEVGDHTSAEMAGCTSGAVGAIHMEKVDHRVAAVGKVAERYKAVSLVDYTETLFAGGIPESHMEELGTEEPGHKVVGVGRSCYT
jgi:hypothetical protein